MLGSFSQKLFKLIPFRRLRGKRSKMQLLFEELFKKIFGLVNENNFLVRWIMKIVIFVLIIAFGSWIGLSIYRRNYLILLIVTGLIVLAELAHHVRKSRESRLSSDVVKKQAKDVKELLKPEKAKNKNMLRSSKPKNKSLLGLSKSKNKSFSYGKGK